MKRKITGINTPLLETNETYIDKKESKNSIYPNRKINVFVSSICGEERFDKVRANLKELLEETNLVNVYLFEKESASTLSAEEHFRLALENSDVCVFLIDNEKGVTPGVQKEIDTVNRCNIKALYYFCDETKKEKTAFELSLRGATNSKSKTIHKFDSFSHEATQALINDILNIYAYYCKNRLEVNLQELDEPLHLVELTENGNNHIPMVPKAVLTNIDKCKNYIMKYTTGFSTFERLNQDIKTSDIDDWGEQLLLILFERKSIKNFNTGMFLEILKANQDEGFFNVVKIRWHAIQSYFLGDIAKCIDYLKKALQKAKDTSQPLWVIQDILIDLRNEYWIFDIVNNNYNTSSIQKSIQKELNEIKEIVNYPVLDRINESLNKKYIDGFYKVKMESPYTVSIGNNYNPYGDLLASSFIVSIYNGSLTHILCCYDRIKDFIFYLSSKHNDWKFRKELLKLAIFKGYSKEAKEIQNSYPEILNKMNAEVALEIMDFCDNHPIEYRRKASQLLAFGTIGYYLNDSDYKKYEEMMIEIIKEWLDNEKSVSLIGNYIFTCLTGIAYRTSEDVLAEICCLFMDKHYTRWYRDMFKFVEKHININNLSEKPRKTLVQYIMDVLGNENEIQEVKYSATFLIVLRKQNSDLTKELDEKIAECLPEFYADTYRLETTINKQKDYPEFIKSLITSINKSNKTQGNFGCFVEYGTRDIETVRAILLEKEFLCSSDIIDSIISVVSDTLLISKEGISIKLDAIHLLTCIAKKYTEDYRRNTNVFKNIIENKEDILDVDNTLMSSNIDKVSLKIALALLCVAMDEDGYMDFLEGMACIQDDLATSISVAKTILFYLELDDNIILPPNSESVVLQNVLQWLQIDNVDIKWFATKILFMLIRNSENANLVNQKIINLIDTESVQIKDLILRQINTTNGIFEKTRNYVFSKCQNDPCYVVRRICAEVQGN